MRKILKTFLIFAICVPMFLFVGCNTTSGEERPVTNQPVTPPAPTDPQDIINAAATQLLNAYSVAVTTHANMKCTIVKPDKYEQILIIYNGEFSSNVYVQTLDDFLYEFVMVFRIFEECNWSVTEDGEYFTAKIVNDNDGNPHTLCARMTDEIFYANDDNNCWDKLEIGDFPF